MGRRDKKPVVKPPATTVPPATRASTAPLFWSLFALALVVRLIALGRSQLWCDEILFVQMSSPPMTPWEVIVNQWNKFIVVTHFPLPEVAHDLFLWVFSRWFESAAQSSYLHRLPAIIWGSFAVPLVFLFARRVLPKASALVAALMMALFFYPVYYAREAYYYAPLVCSVAGTLTMLFGALQAGRISGWKKVLLVLGGLGMVYSHLTGTALLVTMLIVMGLTAAFGRWRQGTVPPVLGTMALLLLIPLAAVSPFYIKMLVQRDAMQYFVPGLPMTFILNDLVAKAFIGKLTVTNALAWVVFVSGVAVLAAPGEKALERRLLAAFLLPALVLLAYSAHKSQYNLRYFAVLMPLLYALYAAGLQGLVRFPARRLGLGEGQGTAVYAVASGLVLLMHAGLFLPAMYAIRAKAVDYGGIAKWMNENLRPGTPFCFDTGGWDLRFVPGYFPTPNLTPAVWVAWNGPDYDPTKRRLQGEMMQRFPESAYIEGYVVDWDVPRKFFKRAYELKKGPVDRLRRLGMWIDNEPPGRDQTDRTILYNTHEDAIQIARERNQPVFFDLRAFRSAQIAREVYAYVGPVPSVTIGLVNLREQPQRGHLEINGGLAGEMATYGMKLSLGQQVLIQTNQPAGMLRKLVTPEFELPAAGAPLLVWTVQSGAVRSAQGVIVTELNFIPAASSDGRLNIESETKNP